MPVADPVTKATLRCCSKIVSCHGLRTKTILFFFDCDQFMSMDLETQALFREFLRWLVRAASLRRAWAGLQLGRCAATLM
jgi:hypothetical protein